MAKIKRFKVLKTSLFFSIYSFLIAFIFSLIMWVAYILISNLSADSSLTASLFGDAGFSWYYVILFPLLYGIFAFIGGIILVSIMNLTLKITKGIDFDLELADKVY